jgi:transcriptional regulator with XRE-family HTH domain
MARKSRSLSTQRLSDLCAERVGFAVPRNTIVNLETGRKESISVQELVAIALALNTPPITLLYGLDREVEIAPGQARNPFHAIEWFAGVWSASSMSELTESDRHVSIELRSLRDYVQRANQAHQYAALIDSLTGDRDALELRIDAQDRLDFALDQMSKLEEGLARDGIHPPEIPWLESVRKRKTT